MWQTFSELDASKQWLLINFKEFLNHVIQIQVNPLHGLSDNIVNGISVIITGQRIFFLAFYRFPNLF
jgi:hypothetical protein